MSLIGPPQYSTIFEQKDGAGQFHDRVSTCQALIDWADVDELAFNCDLSQLSAAQNAGVEDAWYQLLRRPIAARTRRTTRSRSCTWCAA